jgi:hypothetical protein
MLGRSDLRLALLGAFEETSLVPAAPARSTSSAAADDLCAIGLITFVQGDQRSSLADHDLDAGRKHHRACPCSQSFATAGGSTRYNTLIEGFCDFFTLNVRKAMTIDAPIAARVEGPYANGNAPPPDRSGVYPSHADARLACTAIGSYSRQATFSSDHDHPSGFKLLVRHHGILLFYDPQA